MCSFQCMGLGKQIKHYRTKAGLTLAQLAELSDVDTGTIGALEVRDSSRSQFFPSLAKAFGLTVEQLADETKDYPIVLINAMSGPPAMASKGAKPADWGAWGGSETPAFSQSDDDPPMFMRARTDSADNAFDASVAARGPTVAQRVANYLTGRPTLQPILAWEYEDELPPGEYVMVPRLDVHLSAGNGNEGQIEISFSANQPQAFQAAWIRQKHLKPKKLAAMNANGHSMEPSIYDGDSLLVDTSQTDVKDGNVYALWYEGGERVKRLFRLPGGGLRIKSDNPQHDTIELDADHQGHIRIIGRVVHRSGEGGL
jgi:phage repressor protein C with HTH and peptisase S24 domain/DNA-binding XRE family transcriptional regulator